MKRPAKLLTSIALLFVCPHKGSTEMTAMSLQERVRRADVILVCHITKSYDTGVIKEAGVQRWRAKCQVKQLLKGRLKEKTIQIGFIQVPLMLPSPQALENGKTYLLFLKDKGPNSKPRYKFITPNHAAIEYGPTYWVYDEGASEYTDAREKTAPEITNRVGEIIKDQQKTSIQETRWSPSRLLLDVENWWAWGIAAVGIFAILGLFFYFAGKSLKR